MASCCSPLEPSCSSWGFNLIEVGYPRPLLDIRVIGLLPASLGLASSSNQAVDFSFDVGFLGGGRLLGLSL